MAKITRRKVIKHIGKGVGASLMIASNPASLLAQPKEKIAIGTAGKGGVFYPLGMGLAQIISMHTDIEAQALVTSGAAENMKLLQEGKVALALAQADVCWAAAHGQINGLLEQVPVRTLLGATSGYIHIVTLEGLEIDGVGDLKGKRVSTGLSGSGTEVKSLRVLEAYGVTPNNLGAHVHQDYPQAAEALKEGNLDAFCWDATLPGKSITDLALTPGIKIRLLATGDAVPKMVEKYGPFYYVSPIPKGTYPGIDEDVLVTVGKTLLVTNDRMTELQAYEITRALLEYSSELASTLPATRELTPRNAALGSSVPFHVGALRYYKEMGISVRA